MEGGIEMISMSIIKDKITNFCDIATNPEYYEVTEDKKEKDFFTCANEGFIPKNKIDTDQTKFLDVHCKCGAFVILATFSIEEIDFIIHDIIEARRYGMLCNTELSKVFDK